VRDGLGGSIPRAKGEVDIQRIVRCCVRSGESSSPRNRPPCLPTPSHTQPINLSRRQSVGSFVSDALRRWRAVAQDPLLVGFEPSRTIQRQRRTGASSPLPFGKLDQSQAGGVLGQYHSRLTCDPPFGLHGRVELSADLALIVLSFSHRPTWSLRAANRPRPLCGHPCRISGADKRMCSRKRRYQTLGQALFIDR
jgi:hypothetical protein